MNTPERELSRGARHGANKAIYGARPANDNAGKKGRLKINNLCYDTAQMKRRARRDGADHMFETTRISHLIIRRTPSVDRADWCMACSVGK